ncbi:MAG: tripartite tricarboxylate transporter TctB family protein [Flammeovirgaceae bacterium]
MQESPNTKTKYINYVIVLHGIGDQRANETVLPVINRFAEVRQNASKPQKREVVTLGMITSQTGKPRMINGKTSFSGCFPWAEFDNIPQSPYKNLPPFLGEPSFMGENIRFVDMHWADIMEREFKFVGQKTGVWAKSLLGRLEVKTQDRAGNFRGSKEEAWVLPILYQLEETLIFLDNLLSFKFPFIDDLIFNKFLGDVQLYGEYQQIRGKAVRRFHNLMEKIEREHIKQHCPDSNEHFRYLNAYEDVHIKPRYIILSHSLGTVLAMDALLYGHLHKEVYEFPGKYSNLPFPGYAHQYERSNEANLEEDSYAWLLQQRNEYLGENWIGNIDSLVTLGSPIDKFLTIWWQNYIYLGKEEDEFAKRYDTIDQIFFKREGCGLIKHYNYCDEQDPVGHKLDKFSAKKVYNRLFDKQEDIVFNRYGTPGVAHVKYWDDIELFKRIVQLVVDKKPKEEVEKAPDQKHFDYRKGAYGKVLFFTYGLLQLIGIIITSFFVLWGWESEDWKTSVLGSIGLIGSIYLLRKFIKLSIWWRQVLKSKSTLLDTWKYQREHQAFAFRLFMKVVLVILIFLDLTYIPTRFAIADMEWKDVLHYLSYSRDLLIISLVALIAHYLLYTSKRTGPSAGILNSPEFLTCIFSLIIVAIGCFMAVQDIQPLKGIFTEESGIYNNFFSVVLITSTIIWLYTVTCHAIARKMVITKHK